MDQVELSQVPSQQLPIFEGWLLHLEILGWLDLVGSGCHYDLLVASPRPHDCGHSERTLWRAPWPSCGGHWTGWEPMAACEPCNGGGFQCRKSLRILCFFSHFFLETSYIWCLSQPVNLYTFWFQWIKSSMVYNKLLDHKTAVKHEAKLPPNGCHFRWRGRRGWYPQFASHGTQIGVETELGKQQKPTGSEVLNGSKYCSKWF